MHRQDIAHRDLKCSNILIGHNYRLKLADFGFSKDCNREMKTYCGTPVAMSPQILRNEKYTKKCDVWSLGILTYTLLFNKAPFMPGKGEGTDMSALKKAILKGNL